MEIKSANFLRNHSDELLNFINKSRTSVIITKNDEAKAVLQDYASFKEFKEAFYLLKFILKGENDYRNGKVIPHDELKKQMEQKFKNMQDEHGKEV